MLTGANFIGSRESRAAARGFRARNPVTGKALAPAFAEATPAGVGDAARAAESAFEEYAGLPSARWAAFLRDANPRGLWRLVDGRLTQDAP